MNKTLVTAAIALGVLGSTALSLALDGPSESVALITDNEATVPPPSQSPSLGRNLTRGPAIEMVSPIANFPNRSPFRFTLRFKSSNGVPIDPKSLRIDYVRSQNIEITPRIAPFTNASGVDIPQATAPSGTHYLSISVTDQAGRKGEALVVIKVSPSP